MKREEVIFYISIRNTHSHKRRRMINRALKMMGADKIVIPSVPIEMRGYRPGGYIMHGTHAGIACTSSAYGVGPATTNIDRRAFEAALHDIINENYRKPRR